MGKERNTLIMIATGGTGGHIFPGLAVAKYFSEQGVDVVWVGGSKGLEKKLVPAAGYKLESTSIKSHRGKGIWSYLIQPMKISYVSLQAFWILRKYKPDVVLGMGGFVSGPVSLMAAALNIPLIIHEQNVTLGLANRWLAPFSKKVLFGFPNTVKLLNAEYTGNPVRREIEALAIPQKRYTNRKDNVHLLVIGGSLGAEIFNEVVPTAVSLLKPDHLPTVKLQVGVGKMQDIRKNIKALGVEIEIEEFFDDMAKMYEWADVILCRAGALSISEVMAVGIASILVPYPYSADNHQLANAHYLLKEDASIVIPQSEFTPQKLAALLTDFSNRRNIIIDMAIKARSLAQINVAETIAQACLREIRR